MCTKNKHTLFWCCYFARQQRQITRSPLSIKYNIIQLYRIKRMGMLKKHRQAIHKYPYMQY